MKSTGLPISDVSRGVLVALMLALLFVGGIYGFSLGPRKISRALASIQTSQQEEKGHERENAKRRPDLDHELPIHRVHPTGQVADTGGGGGGGGGASGDAAASGGVSADAAGALRQALRKFKNGAHHTYDITITTQGHISAMGKGGLSFLDGVPADALDALQR